MNQSSTQAKENLTFDPDALREKYRVERDKRLRKDGNEQYLQAKGDFTHYVDDPYISERLDRDALMDAVTLAAPGTGIATRARHVTFNLTSIYRFAKSWVMCLKKSTPMHPRYCSTVDPSVNTLNFTMMPAFRPRSPA